MAAATKHCSRSYSERRIAWAMPGMASPAHRTGTGSGDPQHTAVRQKFAQPEKAKVGDLVVLSDSLPESLRSRYAVVLEASAAGGCDSG